MLRSRVTRRQLLQGGTADFMAAVIPGGVVSADRPLRIAFLHLAPRPGDLTGNRHLVERGIDESIGLGADWILTPELCVCGYDFAEVIGLDWILPQPDPWVRHLADTSRTNRVTLFLSHPERDRQTDRLYNSLFVLTPEGSLAGVHRKVHVIPGSESWSSPGGDASPVALPQATTGLLICADAYTSRLAERLKAQGAQLLVSAAAWGPGPHGPHGEWEACSKKTALPLFVCNRTGADRKLDFTDAESLVVKNGTRLMTFQSPRSAVTCVEWNLHAQDLSVARPQTVYL